MLYLCTRNTTTGCSAVRLAHLVWDQRVPGSNPGIPTERNEKSFLFFCCDTKNSFNYPTTYSRFGVYTPCDLSKKRKLFPFLLRNEKNFCYICTTQLNNLILLYERKS